MPALLTPEQQSTLAERLRMREAPTEEEFVHLFSNRIALLARTQDSAADPVSMTFTGAPGFGGCPNWGEWSERR
jgi:hypothetical protein